MRSKAPLALMEQLVMALVFALAAALCVQAFAAAEGISRTGAARDKAVILVQTAAETLKGSGGDYERTASSLGGAQEGTAWAVYYDEDLAPADSREAAAYILELDPQDAGDGLGAARVGVYPAGDAEPLFGVTVAWQEVDGNG